MTKRGLQIGGAGSLPVRERERRGRGRLPRPRPRRPAPTATRCRGSTTRRSPTRPARRVLEPQQGVRQHLFLRPVGPRRAHVADDAAAAGRRLLHERSVAGHRAGAGVPDARRPERSAGAAAVQPRAAGLRVAAGDGLGRAHVLRARRIRGLPQSGAGRGAARLRVADRRVPAAGRGVVLQRAGGRARARLRARQRDARPHAPGLRDPDHVGRRRPHVRARLERLRRRTSSRRSSRARTTCTCRTRTRAPRRSSTRRSTTTTSRSSSAPTATSATTASATRTS